MAFFKSEASFLEKITMGAIGAQKVIELLNANGHNVIELERYSTSNKIWATKIKRLRLPDLLCLKCGRRIESRAKSKLGIIMSDNENDPLRRWYSGMQGEDYVAFIACDKDDQGKVEASQTINLFSINDMISVEEQTVLSKPKSVDEGAERDRTWKSYTPGFDFIVEDITQAKGITKLVLKKPNGKTYTYSVPLGHSVYVKTEQSYKANEKIVAGIIPCEACECCTNRTYDFFVDLKSNEPSVKYAAIKALGFLPKTPKAVEALHSIIQNEEDNRIKLESYASLLRLDENIWDEAERFMTELQQADLKMEYVFILGELGQVFPQRVIERLRAVLSMPDIHDEIKAAAIWVLPDNYEGLCLCLSYCFHENEGIRNHAVAKIERGFIPELTADVLSNIGENAFHNSICAHILATADKVNAQAVIDKYSNSKDDITKQWLLFTIGISPKEKYTDLTKKTVESSLEPIRVLDLLWNCYATYTSQIESKSIEYLKLQK